MFSICEICGYTAEPQDTICMVCTDMSKPRSTWVRLVKKVGSN